MTNLGEHAIAIDEKHTGELTPMRTLRASAAAERGLEPPPPHARVRELEERSFLKIEGAIERVPGIAEARDVRETISPEPLIGFGGRLHVHERNLRSGRFNRSTKTRHIFDRLTTKRSAEMTQEDQQQRRAIGQLPHLGRDLHAAATADCAHFSSFRASS
jgi:hypothetical protein